MKQLTLAIFLLAGALIFDSVLEYYGRERWVKVTDTMYLNSATGRLVLIGKPGTEVDLSSMTARSIGKAPAAASTP